MFFLMADHDLRSVRVAMRSEIQIRSISTAIILFYKTATTPWELLVWFPPRRSLRSLSSMPHSGDGMFTEPFFGPASTNQTARRSAG